MHFRQKLVLIALLLLIPPIANAQTAQQIAKKALNSTVLLSLENTSFQGALGSGFVIGNGQIATNHHLTKDIISGEAKLNGTSHPIKAVQDVNKDLDLAIVKVPSINAPALPLGDSNAVQIGDSIYVVGNPLGLEGTFSNGIISAIRPEGNSLVEGTLFQITAPISPGSSGGPVLNNRGEVIGISVGQRIGGQNLNFAIPVNYLKKLIRRGDGRPSKELGKTNGLLTSDSFVKAGAELLKGNWRSAITYLDTEIRLNPRHSRAYLARGGIKLFFLDRYLEAITDFDTAIRLDPNHAANAYLFRGKANRLLGQHFEAITDCNAAIRLDPNHAEAYTERGRLKSTLGQHLEAITDFDTAIRLDPNHTADAYLFRGKAKHELGQFFEAIADYDTTIQIISQSQRRYFIVEEEEDRIFTLAGAYCFRAWTKMVIGAIAGIDYEDQAAQTAIKDFDIAIQQLNRLKAKRRPTLTLLCRAHFLRGGLLKVIRHTNQAKLDFITALQYAERAGDKKMKLKVKEELRSIHDH